MVDPDIYPNLIRTAPVTIINADTSLILPNDSRRKTIPITTPIMMPPCVRIVVASEGPLRVGFWR